ncbi:hypothetical protein AUP07_0474 [methanogenic archaeon mixed culture ISO4-G1]|nr:hypothetical protein AUP07_0474 [methanogenic archaeon mixed culture ISO4-G1]
MFDLMTIGFMALLIIMIAIFFISRQKGKQYALVEATIERIDESESKKEGSDSVRTLYAPVYGYEIDGKHHMARGSETDDPSKYSLGDKKTIAYSISSPDKVILYSKGKKSKNTGEFLIIAGIGIILLGLALRLLL